MKTTYVAYTRVSTQKQGTQGVSLAEQRLAIARYAEQHNLRIEAWHEEIISASKGQRPVFKKMMKHLGTTNGSMGLIMHKVDRGARNLRDWADIGDALDIGVDVRFAHDDLDLWTRGGRLTADIQAVMAADYIRNLREEVKKGIRGRLRQGLNPFSAPRGYLDNGRGRAKTPDPAIAPLIVYAFKRYASGQCSLTALAEELFIRGLVTAKGNPIKPDSLARTLRNPFYKGSLRVSGEIYPGIHQPLISETLFGKTQMVLRSRKPYRRRRHTFRYRRRLRCAACQRYMIGELQKGRVYYRCGRDHKGICVREDRVSVFDPRYLIISETGASENAPLEPWEKFDSLRGVDALA